MNIPHILNNNRGLCPTTAQQKVDVHIIQPAVWDDRAIKLHAQCVDSLKNEPVDIHFVDYVPGDIRAARFAGFSRGIHKYVSFVDWDDYIEPGIFSKCLMVLDRGGGVLRGIHAIVSCNYTKRWHRSKIPNETVPCMADAA